MSIPGASSMGMTGGGGMRFAQTRGRMQNGAMQGVNYPSPFFDIAHTYLPITVKSMFRWCRYYFMTNPIINATVFKLSEYPITEILIDHEDSKVAKKWKEYFEDHLNYRAYQIECGLDYNTYGNCLSSLSFPFKKFLTCAGCGHQAEAKRIRPHWVFTNFEYRLSCPRCGNLGTAKAKDVYFKNESGVRVMRWSPEDVEISYSDLTGEYTYFYNIPPTVRNDVIIGKKDAVEKVPEVFIQALRQQKGVIFNQDMFFHLRRPTLADQDRGWGIPLLLACLKDTFYLQIMKKAQECVAPGTLIETSNGLVQAADVKVGDFVKTHLGRYKTVSAREVRPMLEARGDYAVELAIAGLRQLPSVFSDNHPLWVLRRNADKRRVDSKGQRRSSYVLRNPSLYEFTFVDAGDVEVGDYIGYPTTRSRHADAVDVAKYTNMTTTTDYVYSGVSLATAAAFEKIEADECVEHNNAGRAAKRHTKAGTTPKRLGRYLELDEDLAYIAGWYLGDGSIGARRVDFSMGPDDDGVELQQAIERVFGVVCTEGQTDSRGWLLVASETIFSEFMKGWIPGHAATKQIPREILSASDEVVLAFIRGYLEADGWQRADDNKIAVCCSNRQLTYQLWSLLLSLGCISTVSERISRESVITHSSGKVQTLSAGRPVFYWAVSNKSARRLSQLMRGDEAELVTSGKSGFFVHGYFAARVQHAEVVDCPEVISFEVLDDHTFCTPGMATHNSILLEHIVPLRVIFPQAGSGTADPYTTINLVDWRDHVATEIARWRMDQNYIPILPLPIGNQTIGGDGRALLMVQEMQTLSEQLINGMQVPLEFIKGGLSYAGTNISMRMLENQFIIYLSRHQRMANWVMRQVADYMDWPMAKIRFKPFKMADDIQRKAFLFQLNQANKVSDTTLLADSDLSQEKEDQIMSRETSDRMAATEKQQMAQAELQGKQQALMMKMQAKAQQEAMLASQAPNAPGEPGGPENAAVSGGQVQAGAQDPMAAMQSPLNAGQNMGMGASPAANGQPMMGGTDLITMANQIASQLSVQNPVQQQLAIKQLRAQSPELADLVLQILATLPSQQQQVQQQQGGPNNMLGANGQAVQQVDMRPQPEQRSPRRVAISV